ncbi:hypothetical protein F4780DRAFT_778460 [Xylariomycetidae sp. FL0641]|nr:hypothetical protein F4780DRAFT_778460 [Xylariomycetidae sp. FL0641]
MPRYPGLGLPVQDSDDTGYPMGAHGSCSGSQSDILSVRELAMMTIMDQLTEKEAWHKKVFDDKIVDKWRQEALAIPDEQFNADAFRGKRQYWNNEGKLEVSDDSPLGSMKPLKGVMNEATFNCCIKELQSKAKYYESSGLIPTLDASASVVKSDNLISSSLHAELREAFDKLKADQASAPDWHPNTNDMVQDLVHPSMYPLVYGRSRVLGEELVGVEDAIEKWSGKGITIEAQTPPPPSQWGVGNVGGSTPAEFWSHRFQWLPSNVAFQEDGSVKLTSYVNGIHPNKFPDVYRTIEKLIQAALPAWDQCLVENVSYDTREGAGRTKPRFPVPSFHSDDDEDIWDRTREDVADVEVDWEKEFITYEPEYDDETERKWEALRRPDIPDPEFEEMTYAPEAGKRLADKFRDSGLQVIVKVASIELTPEKPEFPAGGWHVEGMMNEHICGTALYYLDSENVTSSSLSFRMQTDAYLNDDLETGQDSYHWLEQIYGTCLGQRNSPCLQNYGSVTTKQGRLLAFPNVFQHRVSPFQLADPTKPGHRRFIALWLVDPTLRILSTANVPPQQMSWWMDAAFGKARKEALAKLPVEIASLIQERGLDADAVAEKEGKLPPELTKMVRDYFDADAGALPMTRQEAEQHRLELMKERGAFVRNTETAWQAHAYSFCEH